MNPVNILKEPDKKGQFRAIGLIAAKLIFDCDKYFLEVGGKRFPAVLLAKFSKWLKKCSLKDELKVFTVYVKSTKEFPYYKFSVVGIYELSDRTQECNYFSIRGIVAKWDYENKKYFVEVRRNRRDDKPAPKHKEKFSVQVYDREEDNKLKKDCLLAFSDLVCSFEDGRMVVQESSMVYKFVRKTKRKPAYSTTPNLKKRTIDDFRVEKPKLVKGVGIRN